MNIPDVVAMAQIAKRLQSLGHPFAFLGGAIVPLLLDNPAIADVRPTKDIDVVLKVTTSTPIHVLEKQLRSIGFRHDICKGAPKCRWVVDDVLVDVMTAGTPAGEFESQWFQEALEYSVARELIPKLKANIITAPYFLATKLDAFFDRGSEDYYGSPDLEDIVTVIDGRAEILDEVRLSNSEIRLYLSEKFTLLLSSEVFVESLKGHVPANKASQMRVPELLKKIKQISEAN